jgi:ADP-ribose pyrophosphatase YjhB (NUDIX family)
MRLFQSKFLIGVTGVIFNEKDEVLLFKHTYRQTPWGLPSGFLKSHEHPSEGLAREIEEESGLIVSVDDRINIQLDKNYSYVDVCYVGTFIGGEFRSSNEVSDYGLFSESELPLLPKNQHLLITHTKEKRIMNRKSFAISLEKQYTRPKSFLESFRKVWKADP